MTLVYTQYLCVLFLRNSSNPDTIGPGESVLIWEVSLFQELKSMQTRYLVLSREESLLQGCPYRGRVICRGGISPP